MYVYIYIYIYVYIYIYIHTFHSIKHMPNRGRCLRSPSLFSLTRSHLLSSIRVVHTCSVGREHSFPHIPATCVFVLFSVIGTPCIFHHFPADSIRCAAGSYIFQQIYFLPNSVPCQVLHVEFPSSFLLVI